VEKNIKYFLNFAGISMMIFYTSFSYGIIARLPECKNVKDVILNVIVELSQIYLIYLIIITSINILFERKIEKRRDSKEFIFLTIANIILLLLITSFFSNKFYNICCPRV